VQVSESFCSPSIVMVMDRLLIAISGVVLLIAMIGESLEALTFMDEYHRYWTKHEDDEE